MSTQSPAGYESVKEYLFSLKARGVKVGLDRMRVLARELGHPELRYPVVHVAGTNGKGSVSAMLEAICRAAGKRTGLYTSPHLVKLGERVQVDRRILSEAEIMAYATELGEVAERIGQNDPEDFPSFFEFMTAMAFLQFARREVDVAIIEVGLGGRLDATNVVDPEVSVITSISLEHCEWLGDTIELIAAEKAGIIKPGKPVVMGRVPETAAGVIRKIAAERNAPLTAVEDVFGMDIANYPLTNLAGDYQRLNAATAVLAAQVIAGKHGITEEAIQRGLSQVVWPGRWQRVTVGGRALILDTSHNPEGSQVLEANLSRLVEATGRKPVVVTGVLGEFRAKALLDVIARYASEIHLVTPQQERACTFGQLEALVPATFAGAVRRGKVEEIFSDKTRCALGSPDDIVVITGSVYLIGEVLARIDPDRGAGEGKLQDF